MNNPLGDALMVEVGNLLAENEIFQECRAAGVGFERILIVRKHHPLVCRESGVPASGKLVQLAAS
jgi:hypothetical protein